MTTVAEHVYKEAVSLNPIDRAELIEKLFESFSISNDLKVELRWKKEIARRRLAYENGDISSDSMDNVFKRLAQR
jgi:putative addiction module component (TIGR02574 family)